MDPTDEGLSREITKWDLIALFVNVTVGAGIFRLPADVQRTVGNYSLPAFALCAVIVGLIALCFAEVGSRFSGTGGPYLYARETFGPLLGFTVGWLLWLTRLGGFATLVQVLVAYLGYFWPTVESGLARAGVITGIVVVLTVINIKGVRQSARVGDVFTVSKLIPLFLFVVVGIFFVSPARLTLGTRPDFGPFAGAVLILIFAFSGFEAVLVNSGEIRQPQKVIPFALFPALGAVVVLFVLIQVVCVGTLPQLTTSERPLVDASETFFGALGPTIISAGAIVGILGTLNAVMLALTRLPFAMALQGQLPAPLTRVHPRFRTPHISILVSAAGALCLSLAGTFVYAVKITVITRVIVYTSTCLALPILRRRSATITPRSLSTGFQLPAGMLISVVCVVLCLWLLASSGLSEVRDVAIAVALGLAFYAATKLSQRRVPPISRYMDS